MWGRGYKGFFGVMNEEDIKVYFREDLENTSKDNNTLTFRFMTKDYEPISPQKFSRTDWTNLVHGFDMEMTDDYVRYKVAYPIPLYELPTRYTNKDGDKAHVVFSYDRLMRGTYRVRASMAFDFAIYKEGHWEIIFVFSEGNPEFRDNINLIMKLKMKKLNIMALICLFSLFVNRVYGQVVEVSGHVYERLAERSEPIPGVTVMIRGEKGEKGNGALTKMDGSFRLKADRNATLIFSYMGFRTVEMKVAKAKKNMDVFMEESVNTMDETVVVAYQSQSRADVGASVTVVNTKDLPPAPVSNVMELLQGRVAGLNVQQNNGAPGSIGTYTIRGISDISVQGVGDGEDEQYILGSSAPLFVIDGIPQEDVGDYDANGLLSGSGVSPLSSLPFEDIEDITVLKDAAATAQYGSRGAYGVILIRTKRGNSAKPQIDFSMDMKVNIPPRLRDVLVGRAERMSRIDQILQNDTSRWNGYYDERESGFNR